MTKLISGIFIGAALVLAGLWLAPRQHDNNPNDIAALQSELTELRQQMQRTAASLAKTARRRSASAQDDIAAALQTLELNADTVLSELKQNGHVVRRRAREIATDTITAAMDTATTASIKSKFARDSELSVFDISVTTQRGVVTLSGEVGSPEEIARAIAIALNTNNVATVISTLQPEPGSERSETAAT
jgi:osmotically-inducible protein OsmY